MEDPAQTQIECFLTHHLFTLDNYGTQLVQAQSENIAYPERPLAEPVIKSALIG